MMHSAAAVGPGALCRSGAACRRHRRQGRQEDRARLAARPRQGQSHRQCAVRQGGRPTARSALSIFTALTLEPPRPNSELERRFLDPIAQRLFAGYPALDYAAAIHSKTLPPNIEVDEFFFEAGQWLHSPYAQQHYISANYTHALRSMLDRGVNVVGQLVAHRAEEAPRAYSLSCNPDLTFDLLDLRRAGRADFVFAGQVNSELPFMPGDAAIGEDEFDFLLDGAGDRLSAVRAAARAGRRSPNMRPACTRRAWCPTAARLQIGIGSLGDAVAQALVLRQRDNAEFCELLTRLGYDRARDAAVHTERFDVGLYGCSEMFVEGMLDLYRAGILKREVDGVVLHAGFFIGSRGFYRALREMPRDERQKFRMTAITFVNELYGDEDTKRRARVNARFLNDAMMATAARRRRSPTASTTAASSAASAANTISSPRALRWKARARRSCCARPARRRQDALQHPLALRPHHHPAPSARHRRHRIRHRRHPRQNRPRGDRRHAGDRRFALPGRAAAPGQGRRQDRARLRRCRSRRATTRPTGSRARCKPAADAGLLPTFPFGTDFTEVEQRLMPALQIVEDRVAAAARRAGDARPRRAL